MDYKKLLSNFLALDLADQNILVTAFQ